MTTALSALQLHIKCILKKRSRSPGKTSVFWSGGAENRFKSWIKLCASHTSKLNNKCCIYRSWVLGAWREGREGRKNARRAFSALTFSNSLTQDKFISTVNAGLL